MVCAGPDPVNASYYRRRLLSSEWADASSFQAKGRGSGARRALLQVSLQTVSSACDDCDSSLYEVKLARSSQRSSAGLLSKRIL